MFTHGTSDPFGTLTELRDQIEVGRDGVSAYTLVETALPTALAPGPVAAPALGAYHVIVQE